LTAAMPQVLFSVDKKFDSFAGTHALVFTDINAKTYIQTLNLSPLL